MIKKNKSLYKNSRYVFLFFIAVLLLGTVLTIVQSYKQVNTPIKSNTLAATQTIYNVKSYGAKGDGVADDTRAIQNTINIVGQYGGIVQIPAGTYLLGTSSGGLEVFPNGQPIQSALLISKDNITLQGDAGKTILKLMPRKKMRMLSISSRNILIKNIIFDGNKSNRNGTVPWPNGDVVDALVYAASNSKQVTFRENEVRNGIEDGIGLWKSEDGLVEKNYIHDNGTDQAGASGISVSLNARTRVINNISERNSIGTWSSFGSNTITIDNNVFSQNKQEGIVIGGYTVEHGLGNNSGFTITNNIVNENGIKAFAAISIASAINGTIGNNYVVNNYYDGIQVSDNGTNPSSLWKITNNICSNTTLDKKQDIGIRILGLSKDITLEGNTCSNNGTHLAHQIVIEKPTSVNSNWQGSNTTTFVSNTIPAPVVIYELIQSAGYNLYTASVDERDSAIRSYGYRLAGKAFLTYTQPFGNLKGVTRLSNAKGSRLYTLSPEEITYAKSIGFGVDGIAFYASAQPFSNSVPVYRLSNQIGNFYYTASAKDKLAAEQSGGYKTDGIAFYVPAQ